MNRPRRFFRTRYRIVNDGSGDLAPYHVEYRYWYLPIWLHLSGSWGATADRAREKTGRYLNPLPPPTPTVVEYLN